MYDIDPMRGQHRDKNRTHFGVLPEREFFIKPESWENPWCAQGDAAIANYLGRPPTRTV